MVDGAALLTTLFHGMRAGGRWSDDPGTNFLDSGAHFYEVYATSDGGHVAVGAIEPQFYERLLGALELSVADAPQWDRARWPELKQRFSEISARARGRTGRRCSSTTTRARPASSRSPRRPPIRISPRGGRSSRWTA
jgi:crotonobetainyl-CoA:carnitine CoA-transferase CaiB-like acyl-CoA transferase